MHELDIRRLSEENQTDLNRCDHSFTVEAVLCLHVEALPDFAGTTAGTGIDYTIQAVTPYVKQYGSEVYDAREYIGRADHAAWLAYVDGELAGQILVRENWNRLAIVWDIAVNPRFRRMGAGRALVEQAIAWARKRGLAGVMLETQNINLPACCLYERCGFRLGGFDRYLYQGEMPGTEEIALFWYLLFDRP